VFSDAANVAEGWNQYDKGYTYGLYGTPTTLQLATRICELEHGFRTIITPSGQNAIALVHLAFLKSGDHILLPENIYGPNRKLAKTMLQGFGVESSIYEPTIGGGIEEHIRPNTKMIWCESPGSITMEVQDIPAIVRVAHKHGALVALDNTWSAGIYFDAFGFGVDISLQALTKYIAGHSDVLLGSVTARNLELWDKLGAAQQVLGIGASPDDCSLALRGMKTLAVRLREVENSALEIARWLEKQTVIERVLHPALPSCPGHEIWKRDFTGATGVFSFLVRQGATQEQVFAFVNALELFKVGYSWGGVSSLALSYDFSGSKNRPVNDHRLIRFNIGLEDKDDLIADIEQALKVFA
jgi:cystathionine beta-lyase